MVGGLVGFSLFVSSSSGARALRESGAVDEDGPAGQLGSFTPPGAARANNHPPRAPTPCLPHTLAQRASTFLSNLSSSPTPHSPSLLSPNFLSAVSGVQEARLRRQA